MNRDDFLHAQHVLSCIAGMNQRYHQIEADRLGTLDARWKIANAIAATLGLGFAVASLFISDTTLNVTGVVLAAVTAVAAFVVNVSTFGERHSENVNFLRRWTEVREEVDDLLYRLGDRDPSEDDIKQLRRLDAKKHRISGDEPLADRDLLDACQDAEERSRGCGLEPAVAR